MQFPLLNWKIDLSEEDNEQAIFDTINTAGVRLSCADTIKNSIFQKAMENAQDEVVKKYIIEEIAKLENCLRL